MSAEQEAPGFDPPVTGLIIYGPESLYENSRNQWESLSAPGKVKIKKSITETVRKAISCQPQEQFSQAGRVQ